MNTLNNIRFLLKCIPKSKKEKPPYGLDPTFYHTGTYQGDLELYEQLSNIEQNIDSTLEAAVVNYFEKLEACNQCTALLISDGTDPRPAQIMREMYQAQSDLFNAVGINYHGGTKDGKR